MKVSRYLILIPAALIIFTGCGSSDSDDHGRGDDAACVGGLATNNIASMDPKNGATGSDVASPIRITFACDIDETTINDSSLIVSWDDVVVEGTVTYETATRTLIFTPKFPLYSGMTYDIKISGLLLTTAAPKSIAKISGDVTKSFTTYMTPLVYSSTLDPADPATPTQRNIWTMNADGSSAARLTSYSSTVDIAHTTVNAWSPDDRYIAYVLTKNLSGTYYNFLMVMNADGTEQNVVAGDSGTFYWLQKNPDALTSTYFAWAPDASKIYFIYKPDDATKYDIYSVRPDGTEKTRITNIPEDTADDTYELRALRVSPDGSKLIYNLIHTDTVTGSENAMYLINTDGTGATDITTELFKTKGPFGRFSQDGNKIYVTGTASVDLSVNLYSYAIDEQRWTNLTNLDKNSSVRTYDLSLDGRFIVYNVEDQLNMDHGIHVISTINGTDSELTNITPVIAPAGLREVAISPDGLTVAYIYITDMGDQYSPVYVYTISTSNAGNAGLSDLNAVSGSYQSLIFSPSGSSLAYNFYEGPPKFGIINIAIGSSRLTDSDTVESRLEAWW